MNSQKTDLIGLKKDEISNLITPICGNNSSVNMRVLQLWDWIYTKGETDFTKMTNMSKKFRDTLNEKFYIGIWQHHCADVTAVQNCPAAIWGVCCKSALQIQKRGANGWDSRYH